MGNALSSGYRDNNQIAQTISKKFFNLIMKKLFEEEYKMFKISYYLAWRLRWDYNSSFEEKGFIELETILNELHLKNLLNDINNVENFIDYLKKIPDFSERFEIFQTRIRAKYGHSNKIKADNLYEQISNDELKKIKKLYHVTKKECKDKILNEGLKKMDRKCVHLYKDKNQAKSKASKRYKEKGIVILIDVMKAVKSGVKFYKGDNNVILSEDIPKSAIEDNMMDGY
jgi:putative RNA 2'-phosphotransferase